MVKTVKTFFMRTLPALMLLPLFQNAYGAADPEYIYRFDKDLSLRTYIAGKFMTLNYYVKKGDKQYTYEPNNPLNLGLGFSWKGITINGSYGLSFLKNEDYGDTDSIDYQMNYFKGNFALGFAGQKYKGFYLSTSGDTVLRPDIEVINIGGYASYIFSGNKLSYRAAFNQGEKQIKSAGSFQAGIELFYTIVEAKKSLDPSGPAEPQKMENFQFGPNAGYAYTWIIKKDYFVMAALSLGANVDFMKVNGEEQSVMVTPSAFPRFALGYNSDDWGISLAYTNNVNYVSHQLDEEISTGLGSVRLTYTRRFSFKPSAVPVSGK